MSTYTSSKMFTKLEPASKVRYWELEWERRSFEYDKNEELFKHYIYWKLLPRNNDGTNYKDSNGKTVAPVVNNKNYSLNSANVCVSVTDGTICDIVVNSTLGSESNGGYSGYPKIYDFTNQAGIPTGNVTNATLYYIEFVDGVTRMLRNKYDTTGEDIILCEGTFTICGDNPQLSFSLDMDSHTNSQGSEFNRETGNETWTLAPAYYILTIKPNGGQVRNGDEFTYNDVSIKFIPGRKTYIGKRNNDGNYESDNRPKRDYYQFKGFSFSKGSGGIATSADYFYIEDVGQGDENDSGYTYIFYGDHVGDVVATAQWVANTVTITYDANGGTFTNNQSSVISYEDSDISLQQLSAMGGKRAGHHIEDNFDWIALDSQGTPKLNSNITYEGVFELLDTIDQQYRRDLKTNNITLNLYANWVINTYNVSIYGDGIIVNPTNLTIEYGQETELYNSIEIPDGKEISFAISPTGYVTIEWNPPEIPTIMVEGDLEHNTQILVTINSTDYVGRIYFHRNNGTLLNKLPSGYTENNGDCVRTFGMLDGIITLPRVTDLFKYDYNFVENTSQSWIKDTQNSKSSLANGYRIDTASCLANGNYELHLFANWSPTYLTIRYELIDPDNISASSVTTIENRYELQQSVTLKTPYEVFGDQLNSINGYNIYEDHPWMIKNDPYKVLHTNYTGNTITVAEQLYTENMLRGDLKSSPQILNIEVNWELIQHLLTADNKGGSPETDEQYIPHNRATSITLRRPLLDGFMFNGWSLNSDGSGTLYWPGNVITISQDTTLYAVWVESSSTSGSMCYIKIGNTWKPAVMMTKVVDTYK